MIQLREDYVLYKMTFSEGGRVIHGTWGTRESDPGDGKFFGRKIDDEIVWRAGFLNIDREWRNYDEKAYEKANRDRWKRR